MHVLVPLCWNVCRLGSVHFNPLGARHSEMQKFQSLGPFYSEFLKMFLSSMLSLKSLLFLVNCNKLISFRSLIFFFFRNCKIIHICMNLSYVKSRVLGAYMGHWRWKKNTNRQLAKCLVEEKSSISFIFGPKQIPEKLLKDGVERIRVFPSA